MAPHQRGRETYGLVTAVTAAPATHPILHIRCSISPTIPNATFFLPIALPLFDLGLPWLRRSVRTKKQSLTQAFGLADATLDTRDDLCTSQHSTTLELLTRFSLPLILGRCCLFIRA